MVTTGTALPHDLDLPVLKPPPIYTSQPLAIYKMRINMMHALVTPQSFSGRQNGAEFQFSLFIVRCGEDGDFEGAHPGAVNREAILSESHRPVVQDDHPSTASGYVL